MLSRVRLIYVVFYVTVVLLGTVHLRTAMRRVFHRYRRAEVEQRQLVEQLRCVQLELEGLLSPAAVALPPVAGPGNDTVEADRD